jgi:hypothetical protein
MGTEKPNPLRRLVGSAKTARTHVLARTALLDLLARDSRVVETFGTCDLADAAYQLGALGDRARLAVWWVAIHQPVSKPTRALRRQGRGGPGRLACGSATPWPTAARGARRQRQRLRQAVYDQAYELAQRERISVPEVMRRALREKVDVKPKT